MYIRHGYVINIHNRQEGAGIYAERIDSCNSAGNSLVEKPEGEAPMYDEEEIDQLADDIVARLKALPPGYATDNYMDLIAAQNLAGIEEYEALCEAFWVALCNLAALNGEVYAVELSKIIYGELLISANEELAIIILKPYLGTGGAADDLVWNRYMRAIWKRGSDDIFVLQRLFQDWIDDEDFDRTMLGTKHRPAFDRLFAVNVEALRADEAAERDARMAKVVAQD